MVGQWGLRGYVCGVVMVVVVLIADMICARDFEESERE
jgi:hypothetical protein